MDIIEIGNRIALRRSQLGLTLDDIANDIGVARSTIQRYEKGKIRTVKLPVLEAIARSMNVNPSWLCAKSDSMELPPTKADLGLDTSLTDTFQGRGGNVATYLADRMTTGEIMRQRRKELGLSAESIAEALDVSPTTVYRYENGDIEKVPGDFLPKLASVLHTTPYYLLGCEPTPPPKADPPDLKTEDGRIKEFIRLFEQLTDSERSLIIAQIKGILSER